MPNAFFEIHFKNLHFNCFLQHNLDTWSVVKKKSCLFLLFVMCHSVVKWAIGMFCFLLISYYACMSSMFMLMLYTCMVHSQKIITVTLSILNVHLIWVVLGCACLSSLKPYLKHIQAVTVHDCRDNCWVAIINPLF